MRVSYIVCTRNRGSSLLPTLNSIAKQGDGELIIVNNGSTDRTDEIIAQWAPFSGMPTRVVFEAATGLSRARNAGVAAATGEIVVFTDDDCQIADDFGAKLAVAHGGAVPTIVGGMVLLGDPLDAPVTIMLDEEAKMLADAADICGFIHGCNMSMPRSVLNQVGIFDERFGAGAPFVSAEDTDYLYRAAALGVPVRYDPTVVVSHFHGRRDAKEIKDLMGGYMIGRGAMAVKHRDINFLKPLYWHAKVLFLERLRGHKRDFDPYRTSSFADIKAAARGMVRAFTVKEAG